jgi:UBX domain-containing protein 1
LAEQAGPDESSSAEHARRTITMYREGFVVDDGPYRRLDDPTNADFLRALAMGRTPAELVEGENTNITVGLVDKRTEEYVEQFQSFSGTGAALGSSAVSGNTVDSSALPAATEVDATQSSTSIQVRLPNGQRKILKINLSSTVLQLAANAKPLLGDDVTSFRLISGFPPKPLEDFDATVEGAGLKGAQVQIQKA